MPVGIHGSLLAGRYRVQSRLGAGGMASVWLCHDERLDRRVAVKRLHADSPGDAERRFLREAKLGASLNHPNLVSIYDTATEDEGLLIVMEYVEGESLAQALRRGPLQAAQVGEIARDLGDALDHVHAQGVVHRDVKPANVLLPENGAVKLVDLGIAVSVDQTRVTRSGIVLGSAAYMAPEQLEGQEVSPAADVYALAVVCFEALAGRKARSGRTPVEIAHSVATTPPPDMREHAPEVPAAASAALVRGMAREPARRQGSAGELAAQLASGLERRRAGERLVAERTVADRTVATRRLAGEPGGAAAAPPPAAASPGASRTASRTAAARPQPPRRRSLAGALAVALIALAAAAVVAAVLLAGGDGNDQQADQPAERSAQRQQDGQQQAPANDAPAEDAPAEETPAEEPPAEPAPTEPPADDGAIEIDPARGAALNEQGFALMNSGDYAGAVPILEKAVASWPEDSTDINYAYALYNLGVSLNRSGRAEEAIPYLEQRLTWSNQRGIVKQELKAARRNAGQG